MAVSVSCFLWVSLSYLGPEILGNSLRVQVLKCEASTETIVTISYIETQIPYVLVRWTLRV